MITESLKDGMLFSGKTESLFLTLKRFRQLHPISLTYPLSRKGYCSSELEVKSDSQSIFFYTFSHINSFSKCLSTHFSCSTCAAFMPVYVIDTQRVGHYRSGSLPLAGFATATLSTLAHRRHHLPLPLHSQNSTAAPYPPKVKSISHHELSTSSRTQINMPL